MKSLKVVSRARRNYSVLKSVENIHKNALDYSPLDLGKKTVAEWVLGDSYKLGEKLALVDGYNTAKKVTYAQLHAQVAETISTLRKQGLRDGDTILFHLPNCIEYIILLQSSLGAGAVVSTANVLYTPEELKHQLQLSNAKFVITLAMFKEVVTSATADGNTAVEKVFVLGEPSGNILLAPPTGPKLPEFSEISDPRNHVAVLPFSSGTTGQPKGVELTHHNIASNIHQIIDPRLNLCMEPDDRVLGVLPLFHIYGQTVVAGAALKRTATVYTVPKFEPERFIEVVTTNKLSFLPLVPPLINFLARSPLVNPETQDFSSIRRIFSGAAPLDGETEALCSKRLNCKISQGYGMTESSPVTHIPALDTPPGSIGKPVVGTDCAIVDPVTLNALPRGKDNVGELWVRGDQIMKGYISNPSASAETLVDGFLRTGDMGYSDEAGNYYIVDRLKELIKVKGFQVPPAELEGLLLQHPGLADAAVIGMNDPASGEVPVAFVVTKKTAFPNHPKAHLFPIVTGEDVKDFIAGHVAPYKRLHDVIFTEAIPKSAAGKILRKDLRKRLAKA